jgi:hypothetical protein
LFNSGKEEKMKRLFGLLAVGTLLSLAPAVFAQAPPSPEGTIIIKQRMFQGPEAGPAPPPGADFVWVASESFGGKTVKGAPYSAEAVTESIQTLSDGNRIVNKITSMVYRDSEGRTRREQTLKGLGSLGTSDEPLQTIFINDPVTGVTYSLDSRSHMALKGAPFTFEFSTPGTTGPQGQTFEFKVAPGAAPPQAGIRVPGPEMKQFTFRTEDPGIGIGTGGGAMVFRTRGNNANEVKEQLGKQIIEGVEAEGTRTTITIPAGEIGNERAIEIVSERWYSPELQLVVMTRHSDPRLGETTYKLTNINRTEQPKSLFEVPAGYTVKEGPHFGPNVAPLPRRKLANPE